MEKDKVIKKFKKVLAIKNKDNENHIQRFLENHTDFIPEGLSNTDFHIHSNFVFSKLRISENLICDFAYLTKRTFRWTLVLIDIKSSNLGIFTKSKKDIHLSQKFNNAKEPILSWKSYLETHPDAMKEKLHDLIANHPYRDNPMSVEYVLVYGRNSEINSDRKAARFLQEEEPDIKIITYDTLIRYYRNRERVYKNIITKEKGRFKLKVYKGKIYGWENLSPEIFYFDKNIRKQLIKDGLDIPQWEKGKPISEYGIKPLSMYKNFK